MAFKGNSLLKSASLALVLALALPVGGAFAPTAAAAATLPAPYVSRALDAVLIPVDGSVISAFGLASGSKGVLVLATQPGGLADSAGILPGDVIDFVGKRAIAAPIELDEVVYYWLTQGVFDFVFGTFRNGAAVDTTTTITLESWEQVIEVTTVSTWTSYSYESFSYSEYTTEYSEEITTSYEESSSMIEETVTSEEFSQEMTSEEATSEEATAEDATDEATADEATADEATADDAAGDEAAADDAGADDAAADGGDEVDCPDGVVVDGVCQPNDEPQDDAAADDGGDDAADDGADAGGDDGGDAGGDDGGDAVEE